MLQAMPTHQCFLLGINIESTWSEYAWVGLWQDLAEAYSMHEVRQSLGDAE
jgi:hypothetical protein